MGCVQVRHLIVLANAIIRFGCTTRCLPRVAWWPNLLGACNRRRPRASVPRQLCLLCEMASTVPTGTVCSERKFHTTSRTRRTFCSPCLLPFPRQCWSSSVGGGSPPNPRESPFQAGLLRSACELVPFSAGQPLRPTRGDPPGETHPPEGDPPSRVRPI